MYPCLITLGLKKRIDLHSLVESERNIFKDLHRVFNEYIKKDWLISKSFATWDEFRHARKTDAQEMEAELYACSQAYMESVLKTGNIIPDTLKDMELRFHPDSIRIRYHGIKDEHSGAFLFTYQSDPLTFILQPGENKLLCATGDRIQDISRGKTVETFLLQLSDEITIKSYTSPLHKQ